MARKLINTKEISHEQWLILRKKSIGGSDAGALMDMNPYQSPVSLYADKKGLSKDKETNEAMRLGNDLEDYVDAQVEYITDIMEIMQYDIMSTPAVVIDGQVKISRIEFWISSLC